MSMLEEPNGGNYFIVRRFQLKGRKEGSVTAGQNATPGLLRPI